MNEFRGKLEGMIPPYRILDFADDIGGIFGTKLLADLGADVIKVEPPAGGKDRRKPPFFKDEVHPEKSLYFLYYNTSKRSITLNIEHEDGQAIFKELAKGADAVVESFSPGYMKSLGLDYESLRGINDRLVMASVSPFGQTGPCSHYQSSDLITMAMSGYAYITGDPKEPPVRPGDEQSHFAGAQYAATSILLALYHRDYNSGKGQVIDVSMQEATITYYVDQSPAQSWLYTGQSPTRPGISSVLSIPLGAWPCKDGWVGVGTISAKEWDDLAQWIHEATGDEEIISERLKGPTQARMPFVDEVTARIVNFTSRLTMSELVDEGQRRKLILLPVLTVPMLLTDPDLEAGEFWVELDHPVVGRMKYPRGPFEKGDMPPPSRAAPLLGEDNQEIYCNELGFSKQELGALRGASII
ncbi:CaiB/BaiF CoA transferase family protein [Chloroflexota bacterium]